MAGTGELSVLSRLRLAHGQQEKGTTFGSHMAIHIALGLLFLGEGKYTLGSSNAAVAALVCAFFPRFSHEPSDNKAYPQACRHLWVLAVEPRCFVAQDVESGESVYLPIKVKIREDEVVRSISLISPTLLPPVDLLLAVKVDSPRYWPIYLDLGGNPLDRKMLSQNETIYVKRKSGFLSYDADPKGNRSIFVQAGLVGLSPDLGPMAIGPSSGDTDPTAIISGAANLGMLDGLIPSLTSNPLLISFFRRLCSDLASSKPTPAMQHFCSSILLECLVSDQPQILPLYLYARQLLFASDTTPFLSLALRNIDLAQTHISRFARSPTQPSKSVLRSSLLQEVSRSLEQFVRSPSFSSTTPDLLKRYLSSGNFDLFTAAQVHQLGLYLTFNRVPSGPILGVLGELIGQAHRELQARGEGGHSRGEIEATKGALKLVLMSTVKAISGGGSEWKEESVDEVLDI